MWYLNLYLNLSGLCTRSNRSLQLTEDPSTLSASSVRCRDAREYSYILSWGLRLLAAKYSNNVSCLEMTWLLDLCTSTRGTTFVTGVTRWSSLTRCMLVWLFTCIICNTCDTDLRPGGGDGDPGGEEEEGGGGEARQGAGGEGQEGQTVSGVQQEGDQSWISVLWWKILWHVRIVSDIWQWQRDARPRPLLPPGLYQVQRVRPWSRQWHAHDDGAKVALIIIIILWTPMFRECEDVFAAEILEPYCKFCYAKKFKMSAIKIQEICEIAPEVAYCI